MARRVLIVCAAAALVAGCGSPKDASTITVVKTVVERPAYPQSNDYGGVTCPDGSSGNYGGC